MPKGGGGPSTGHALHKLCNGAHFGRWHACIQHIAWGTSQAAAPLPCQPVSLLLEADGPRASLASLTAAALLASCQQRRTDAAQGTATNAPQVLSLASTQRTVMSQLPPPMLHSAHERHFSPGGHALSEVQSVAAKNRGAVWCRRGALSRLASLRQCAVLCCAVLCCACACACAASRSQADTALTAQPAPPALPWYKPTTHPLTGCGAPAGAAARLLGEGPAVAIRRAAQGHISAMAGCNGQLHDLNVCTLQCSDPWCVHTSHLLTGRRAGRLAGWGAV